MIDTGEAPILAAEYRKIIEREFGRDDFSLVINTHFHLDHTDGNLVFAGAEIIAHESSPERMRQFDRERQNFIAERIPVIEQWKNKLKALDPNSEDAQQLREIISTNPIMLEDLANNYILTLPTITFSDCKMLDPGEAYIENGQNDLAIEYYQKSLKLNPQNTNAVNMLKRIKKKKQ